jgi:hypothetical protein
MAKSTTITETATADTRHLVTVIKNGLTADVTSTSLEGWLKKGWKRLDDKAGA